MEAHIQHVKPIRLSGHAREQCVFRGTAEEEIVQAIRTTPWMMVRAGRFDCRMDLVYEAEWNGKFYATKQIRPIFVEEASEIVVITVYVYYY